MTKRAGVVCSKRICAIGLKLPILNRSSNEKIIMKLDESTGGVK